MASSSGIHRVRLVIKFVIVWLIGLYLFEIVQDGGHWIGGIGAVVVAFAVNVYARKKAAATVNATAGFYFWLYVPLLLLFVLPIAFKFAGILMGDQEVDWWDHFVTLLPFLLKLGVPVGALVFAYVALGRVAKKADDSPVERPASADSA